MEPTRSFKTNLTKIDDQEIGETQDSKKNSVISQARKSSSLASIIGAGSISAKKPVSSISTSRLKHSNDSPLLEDKDLDKMLASMTRKGNFKKQDAEKKLALGSNAPGTYFIRESQSLKKSHPGSICIAYVDNKGKIKHIRLTKQKDGSFSYKKQNYKDASDFVEKHQDILKKPMILDLQEQVDLFKFNSDALKIVAENAKLIDEKGTAIIKFGLTAKTLALSKKGKKIYLTDLNSRTELGKGGFGTVKKATKISINLENNTIKLSSKANKFAHDEPDAISDLKNEYEILHKLHDNTGVLGIQKPPYAIYEIKTGNSLNSSPERVGFLGKQYDGNIYAAKFSGTEKMNGLYQLASGLAHCKEKGVMHGDIKLKNILFKREKEGVIFHLADFGGARFYKDLENVTAENRAENYIFSADYIIERDLLGLRTSDFEEFKKLQEKIDVFALGKVMYEAMCGPPGYGSFPLIIDFPRGIQLRPDETKNYLPHLEKNLKKSGCPNEIKNLILKMMTLDPKARPTAKEVKETFDKYMSSKSPGAFSKFLSWIGCT